MEYSASFVDEALKLFIRHALHSPCNLLIYFALQRPTMMPGNTGSLLTFNGVTPHSQPGWGWLILRG
jgi:hypothetical protein